MLDTPTSNPQILLKNNNNNKKQLQMLQKSLSQQAQYNRWQ